MNDRELLSLTWGVNYKELIDRALVVADWLNEEWTVSRVLIASVDVSDNVVGIRLGEFYLWDTEDNHMDTEDKDGNVIDAFSIDNIKAHCLSEIKVIRDFLNEVLNDG